MGFTLVRTFNLFEPFTVQITFVNTEMKYSDKAVQDNNDDSVGKKATHK